MKKMRKTNPNLINLIGNLKAASREGSGAIWRDLALRLEKSKRNYAAVNVSKVNRHTKSDDLVLVAGKVLGSGDMDHKVTIAALNFSEQAISKINSAGGECIKIEEMAERHPKGSGVIILR